MISQGMMQISLETRQVRPNGESAGLDNSSELSSIEDDDDDFEEFDVFHQPC